MWLQHSSLAEIFFHFSQNLWTFSIVSIARYEKWMQTISTKQNSLQSYEWTNVHIWRSFNKNTFKRNGTEWKTFQFWTMFVDTTNFFDGKLFVHFFCSTKLNHLLKNLCGFPAIILGYTRNKGNFKEAKPTQSDQTIT